MDMESYVSGKAAGSITITKVGFETYQLVARRFDVTSGKETYPEILTVTRKDVDQNVAQFSGALKQAQNRVDGITQLVKDLDGLDATA